MASRAKAAPVIVILAILSAAALSCGKGKPMPAAAGSADYQDLIRLFQEWREFQKPRVTNGVPDYSAPAMKEQYGKLPEYQRRLAAIDPGAWPVSRKIDHRLVRGEMNGLDFDHRVLRPWSRYPGFYAVVADSEPDVPAREGPEIHGVLNLWNMAWPLSEENLAEFRLKVGAIPEILNQARTNLSEEGRDLWTIGLRVQKRQSQVLGRLAGRLAEHHPEVVPEVERAKSAVDEFCAWLAEKQAGMKDVPCGVGVENFDWYMKNVHLVPYTWEEQLQLLQREMERSLSSLRLEQHRNRKLPPLEPAADEPELRRRFDAAVNEFMRFLREEEIFTVPDYMALDLFRGRFIPPGSRDFFTQVDYRDPLPMRSHMFHWLEKQRMVRDPHPSPIRSAPLLYDIWDSRSEGLATGLEEIMMQAGLLDRSPRSRELVYILVAMRVARAMGDLKIHSNEFTLAEAIKYAVDETPYGWLLPEAETVWTDMRIYIQQPGYGTSYLVGKDHIYRLLADRSRQMGKEFSLKRFMDEFFASGLIPVSLIRWEMTGLEDEIKRLW